MEHPHVPVVVVRDADDALVYLGFALEKHARVEDLQAHAERHGAVLLDDPQADNEVTQQMREYLAGERREFELTLRLLGTDFQLQVWDALCRIPYGRTRSYGQQATSLDRPKAARAVGHANGLNPIAIVVPCHRVVGSDGQLTGFGGGIEVKRWLLELERRGVTPRWTPKHGPRSPAPPPDDQLGLFSS